MSPSALGIVASAKYNVTVPPYTGPILADNPLAYWRFGESSGATAADTSGNVRAATLTGTYTRGVTGLVPGDTDKATLLAGGYATTVDVPAWDTSSITLEALIKPTTVASISSIIDRDNDSSSRVYQFRYDTNGAFTFIFWTSAGIKIMSTPAGWIKAGLTYHVAATYNATTGVAVVYVNGVAVVSATHSGNLVAGTQGPALGTHNTGSTAGFSGVIDEAAIYGTALPAATIAARSSMAGLTGVLGSGEVNGSNTIMMAFDGNTGTQWLSNTNTGWLEFTPPTGSVVTQYSVTNHGNDPTFRAKDWTFQGWNGTSWVTLDTVTNKTWASSTTVHTASISAPSYSKYRVNVTLNYGGLYVGFSEFSWVI